MNIKLSKWMKRTIIALVSVAFLYWGCSTIWNNILYAPMVNDGYQQSIDYKGELERKYAMNGTLAIDSFAVESGDERTKRFEVWFPKEMRTTQKKYPLVVMANGTGVFASRYKPIFEHLASWGFIVVGNEDGSSWWGHGTAATLDFILKQNATQGSLFYGKVKTDAIGLAGHSQGGVGTFHAAADFDNSRSYKAICAMSGNDPSVAAKIQCPVLLMMGTGGLDANGMKGVMECYSKIKSQPVVVGRLRNTEHGDVLTKGDAYMTAWMRYWLCGDQQAAKCFVGNQAEIMSNKGWQEQKRKGL